MVLPLCATADGQHRASCGPIIDAEGKHEGRASRGNPPSSDADREEAKSMLEGVLDQEQADFDNMPRDVQSDEEGQRAEEVVDALEQAATCCEDAISACKEVLKD